MLRRLIYAGKTLDKAGNIIPSKVYEAIVPYSLWQNVQVARPARYPFKRTNVGITLATGMIRCGICNAPFYWRDHVGYPMYGCRHKKGCTSIGSYYKIPLFDTLLSRSHFVMFDDLPSIEQAALEAWRANNLVLDSSNRRIEALAKQKQRIIEALSNGTISEADVRSKLRDIANEMASLSQPPEDDGHIIIHRFRIEQQAEFLNGDIKEQRRILKESLRAATVTNHILHIEYLNGWKVDIDLKQPIPDAYDIGIYTPDGIVLLSAAIRDKRFNQPAT
jgi:hypothetical protein